jgi:hypothetical protein
MIYRYVFHTEWCDDKGRLWAERHESDSPSDARKAHKAALAFDWVKDGRLPSVSDLYSISHNVDANGKTQSENGRTSIQPGGRREYHETALPRLRQAVARDEVPTPFGPAPARKEPGSLDTPF